MATRIQNLEGKGSQMLEDIRSKIQVMNLKSEREERKTKIKTIKPNLGSIYTGEGNLTRLMSSDPNQVKIETET